MRTQVVGLFDQEANAFEAARLLHRAGYTASDMDLVSKEPLRDSKLASLVAFVRPDA